MHKRSDTLWPEDGVINLAYNKYTNSEPLFIYIIFSVLFIIRHNMTNGIWTLDTHSHVWFFSKHLPQSLNTQVKNAYECWIINNDPLPWT